MIGRFSTIPRIAFFTILLLIAGCGPTTKIAEETSTGCQPQNVQVEAASQSLDISWKDDCQGLKSGYNIYITDTPLVSKYPDGNIPASVRPFNLTTYPGDTNPDDSVEHFVANGLDNGTKYYVSVRVVNADRTMSRASNEVSAIPGPRGEIELSIRYKGGNDGYSFDHNEYVAADASTNDLYYYSAKGVDYLASPDRLNGFLKKNRLAKLSFRGDFAVLRTQIDRIKTTSFEDKVAIAEGDWLLIRTDTKTSALVRVESITGSGDQRKVKLFFAYDPAPGEMIF